MAVGLLMDNIQILSEALPTYQSNVEKMVDKIDSAFGVDLVSTITNHLQDFNFTDIILSTINSFTDIFGNLFVILLYVVFLLLEEPIFNNKMNALSGSKENSALGQNIFAEINHSISSYLSLKTFVSFVTGFLSYVVLWIMGVEAPVFWAFIIFILNFIPTIGSLIATVFPAVFAFLQFGTVFEPLVILTVVGIIQLLVGNFLEPRLMGNSLNISPLVVLIALSGWGMIWGVTGMLLSVPIMVILIIIFSKFEATRPIAILLSEKGEVH